jgi:hypothetical protein
MYDMKHFLLEGIHLSGLIALSDLWLPQPMLHYRRTGATHSGLLEHRAEAAGSIPVLLSGDGT